MAPEYFSPAVGLWKPPMKENKMLKVLRKLRTKFDMFVTKRYL